MLYAEGVAFSLQYSLNSFVLYNNLYILCRYGGERYEKRDLQMRVRKRFAELQSIDEKHGRVPWHVVDASQSIEEVKEKLAGKSAFVLFCIMNSCVQQATHTNRSYNPLSFIIIIVLTRIFQALLLILLNVYKVASQELH